MSEFTTTQKRVLKQCARAIMHMRQRFARKKFSLVFGAGIGEGFGIPKWGELLDRIAKDSAVKGTGLLRRNKDRSHGPKTQVLFHSFAAKLQGQNKSISLPEIKHRWREIVGAHLYEKARKDIDCLVDTHEYIEPFVEIIQKSPMTVSYNFDDYIEKILHKKAPSHSPVAHARSFETVWDPHLQTKRDDCVVYHPNGFLPEEDMERHSGGLVFCEDEFADQLIETMAGRYAALLHHYSQNTCLFIGLSLEDNTLKHLLRQSATLNPGHYHYYVAYQRKGQSKAPKPERDAVYEANFDLYNLITLFLKEEELKALGQLIRMSDEEFLPNAVAARIDISFCYYVIGAIGAGKSSAISYFRNLRTHDEWPDFRLSTLGERPQKLSTREEKDVDDWINIQFRTKNRILHKQSHGLHIVDRAPLDPIAFKTSSKRAQRARSLMTHICKTDDPARIHGGHVILLKGDARVLEERARAAGKKHTAKDLQKMQEALMRIYGFRGGVSIVDTRRKSREEVVKKIARIIHTMEYKEADLHTRLSNVANGRYKC